MGGQHGVASVAPADGTAAAGSPAGEANRAGGPRASGVHRHPDAQIAPRFVLHTPALGDRFVLGGVMAHRRPGAGVIA